MRNTFSTRLRRQKQFRQKTLSNAALFLIALAPIYPVFGSYMQNYTGVVVRGEYDRSTILASYDWETGESTSDFIQELVNTAPTTTLINPDPFPVPAITTPTDLPETPPKDPKLPLYVSHVVVKGDTLSTIAQKYDIPLSTLRVINNLSSDILSVQQKIIIPRINGVQYAVQKWDTLSTIAQKYGIRDIGSIALANDIERNSPLRIGRTLLLPNPTKDPTKKAPVQLANKPITKPVVSTAKPLPKPQNVKKEPTKDPQVITYWDYTLSLKVSKWCRNFVWGNCTCFVAKYKNVTWRWNAKDWLRNAQKQWISTGDDPKPGAIIVYHGPGFPPAYGHVGIVMAVNDDHMIIKDMNYRALNEVTTRKEDFTNPAILWYIYVD